MAMVAAGISAIGSVAGGVFGMMQANYQAQVAKNNAEIAKYNARRASIRGGIEAQMKDSEAAQLLGEQLTAQAASGVTVSGQSQIRTRNAARVYASADRMAIRENANMERHGFLVDATNFKAEAKSAKASGVASLVGGILEGAGTLAGGIAGQQANQKSSMVGGAKSTPATMVPKPVPRPISAPRPVMPTIGNGGLPFNPLVRRRAGYR